MIPLGYEIYFGACSAIEAPITIEMCIHQQLGQIIRVADAVSEAVGTRESLTTFPEVSIYFHQLYWFVPEFDNIVT